MTDLLRERIGEQVLQIDFELKNVIVFPILKRP